MISLGISLISQNLIRVSLRSSILVSALIVICDIALNVSKVLLILDGVGPDCRQTNWLSITTHLLSRDFFALPRIT